MLKEEKIEKIRESLNRLVSLFIMALTIICLKVINSSIFGFLFTVVFVFIIIEFYFFNIKIRDYFNFEKYFSLEENSNTTKIKEEKFNKEKSEFLKCTSKEIPINNIEPNIDKCDSKSLKIKETINNENFKKADLKVEEETIKEIVDKPKGENINNNVDLEKDEDSYKKYIRKLPKGRKASDKARKIALEYGYKLKEGETFVVPKKKK